MRSLILAKVARGVLPITTLFAVYLLLRGHNEPGGGFIAGLVTAAALVLQGLAFGAAETRARLSKLLRPAAWVGLAVAVVAATIAPVRGEPFFTHYHWLVQLPGVEKIDLSTALLFDVGVYLVVLGVAATAVAVFSEPGPAEVSR